MSERRLPFDPRELRTRTARGGVLNAVFLGGTEALVLIQGLVVTAILGPTSIGLYGIVSTTAVTIIALRRVGIDEAFVQQDEADQELEFRRAFTIELTISLAASLLIIALAPLLALVYDDWRLLPLTIAVSYLPVAFALQAPQWVYFRRMDFLKVRMIQGVIIVVTFLVAVPLTIAGVGVWSLVIGPFVGNVVGVIWAIAISPYRLGLSFQRAAWGRYLRFSWPIFVSSLALLVLQQGQILAFGLYGGIAAAGFITLAATLTRYVDRADQILTTTIYPGICAVRDRIATLEELFAKSNRLTLMWSLPFAATIFLFAEDLVTLVLGEAWDPAIVLLQGLAAAMALQQVGYNWFSFYRARGDSRPQAVEAVVLVVAFGALAVPGLVAWGFTGFVVGRVLTSVAVLAVRWRYVHALLPAARMWSLAVRGAQPLVLAAVPVVALRVALWGGPRPVGQVVAEVVLWFGGLALATHRLERGLLGELWGDLRPGATPSAPAGSAI